MRTVLPEKRTKKLLVKQSAIKPNEKVLDFGCGSAKLTLMLKVSCSEALITGLDIDPAILRLAHINRRAAALEVRLVEYDGGEFPFATASFDHVLSCLVFHHLSDRDKVVAFAEIFRVLKPGGTLHLADWGRPQNALMAGCYFMVRLVDGFVTTKANARGKLNSFVVSAGFERVSDLSFLNTVMGTVRYCIAQK